MFYEREILLAVFFLVNLDYELLISVIAVETQEISFNL